jgi:thymidine phosphorylase
VSAVAGIVCRVKPGEQVSEGEPLLELHTERPDRLDWAREALRGAIEIADEATERQDVVLEVIK